MVIFGMFTQLSFTRISAFVLGGVEANDGTFSPHRWLVDSEVFQPEDIQTFLLIPEEEHTTATAILENQFQPPEDYFTVGSYHVYVFGYDIAADMN